MINSIDFDNQEITNYFGLVPFYTDPRELYNSATLYRGYDVDEPASFSSCYDQQVYSYYIDRGKTTDYHLEALARSSHDFCVRMAMNEFLEKYEKCRVVGIMGGNAMRRDDPAYEKIARISKRLTEEGSLMVSGGGSGAMEATGFGSWMAGRGELEFLEALSRLKTVPVQEDIKYIETSMRIVLDFPQRDFESLSIPTWLYGHEWTSPFATHIAKLFENSVREDTLLTIAYGGIIFAPGRAGTVQEIFQEAVQNHYLTYGMASPMVFLDKDFWTRTIPIYPMLAKLQSEGIYKNQLLHLTDNVDDAVKIIRDFQSEV